MPDPKHTPAQEVALWLNQQIDSKRLWYPNDIIPVIEAAYAPVVEALEFASGRCQPEVQIVIDKALSRLKG